MENKQKHLQQISITLNCHWVYLFDTKLAKIELQIGFTPKLLCLKQ